MGSWFRAILVTVMPRVAAAAGAVIVAKAAQHGVTLDPVETTGVVLGAYGAIHKAISSKVNPGDAAKIRIADAEKLAADHGGAPTVMPSNGAR